MATSIICFFMWPAVTLPAFCSMPFLLRYQAIAGVGAHQVRPAGRTQARFETRLT
jgi:hypothetical protein